MSSHQRSRSQEQANSNRQISSQPPNKTATPQKREGLLGWFQDAGDWVADKYDDTSSAVSNWAGGVYESAENAVEAVSETVSDAKDIWDSTSISKEDGIWNVTTDLDEIADLVPMDMLGLDREASDNQVTMQIDRQKGEVRLQTSSLAVSQLNVSGLTIGSAKLENVQIIVKNAQVNLPLFGEVSVGASEPNARKSATITIGSVTGTNASYGEGAEAIKASQIELTNLHITSEMGGERFGMQPQSARFSVGEARVIGLNSSDLSGNMSVSNAAGSLDQATQSAAISASSVLGSNLSRKGLAIENTALQGLQANIATGANGQVANVSARQATVSGVDVGDMSSEEASDSSLDVNLNLGQATINDLNTEKADAKQIALSNFQLSQSQTGMSSSASSASITGLDTDHVDAESLDLTKANLSIDSQGLSTSAANASASGLDTDWADLDQVGLANLHYHQNNSGLQLSTSGGTAAGLDTDQVDAESLQVGKTSIGYNDKTGTDISLANANITGLTGPANVASLSVNGLSSAIGTDGSSSLNLDQIKARGLAAQGHELGQLTGSSLQAATHSDGSSSGSLGRLTYQDYESALGTSSSGSIHNLQADGNIKKLEGQASIQALNLGATNIHGNQLDSATIQNIRAERHGGHSTATIDSLSAQGIQNQYASAASISGKNLAARHDGQHDNFSGSLEQLQLNSASGFGATAKEITINNASGSTDSQLENADFSVDNVNVNTGNHDIGYLESASLNNIQGTKRGERLSASLAEFDMQNSGLHGIGSTDSVRATGLSVGSDGSTHTAKMNTMMATNIQEHSFGATIGEASLNNVQLSGTGLSNANAHIGAGDIHDAAMQGATLEHGSISNGNAQLRDGQGSATLASIDFNNAAYSDMLSAQSGQARNLSVSGNRDEQKGSVGSVRLDGIQANMPQLRGSLDSASLQGGAFHHTGGSHGTASIDQLKAENALFDFQHAETTGQSFNTGSTPVKVDIDKKRLLESGVRRIDSADINASANMIAGRYGDGMAGFGIKENTQMNADVAIRDNRIQNGSRIGTNRSIDTALWTSTDGLYVKDNQMMADVNGWFDINASGKANKAMGLRGKGLHSLGDYTAAGVGMSSSNDSQSAEKNAMGNPIDLSSVSANGNVALSNGTIDAGGASAQLAGAENGANQMSFEANANRISMAFAQLLSSSLAINTDQGNVRTGTASVENGEVALKPNEATATGSVDRVSVDSINLSR